MWSWAVWADYPNCPTFAVDKVAAGKGETRCLRVGMTVGCIC